MEGDRPVPKRLKYPIVFAKGRALYMAERGSRGGSGVKRLTRELLCHIESEKILIDTRGMSRVQVASIAKAIMTRTREVIPMNVYVLHCRWDNADRDGAEVLGVYAENNLAAAQEAMRENAAAVRGQEEESFWEEDYTWEDEMSVSLGNSGIGPGGGCGVPETYRWEIERFRVLEPAENQKQ